MQFYKSIRGLTKREYSRRARTTHTTQGSRTITPAKGSTLEGPVKAVGCSLVAGYYFLDALGHSVVPSACIPGGAQIFAGNWWCLDIAGIS